MEKGAELQRAREYANKGNKFEARELLRKIIQNDKRNEQAWLLFSQVAEKQEHEIQCLENVLKINPNNEQARIRLSLLRTPPIIDEKNLSPKSSNNSLDKKVIERNNMNKKKEDIPESIIRIQTVGDFLKYTGMKVIIGTKDDNFYEGIIEDLSNTGTYLILREVIFKSEIVPVRDKNKISISIQNIDFMQIKDRCGK